MKESFKKIRKHIFLFFRDPVRKLELQPEIKKALHDLNFRKLTPIQKKALPKGIKNRDIIAQAQTGTGKTAAYLTILYSTLLKKRVGHKQPRALILAPTRELAVQIYKEAVKIGAHTKIKLALVFGGDNQFKQISQLKKGPEIIIATPGRLLAFIHEKSVFLGKIESFVIDEADRMLDMGFMPDVKRIESKIPSKKKRQTLFFSATLPDGITNFARRWTENPKEIRIDPEKITSENIIQKTYLATAEEKFPLLLNLVRKKKTKTTIIFANQKNVAKDIYYKLRRYKVNCRLLTGDIPQKKRLQALEDFQKGRSHILIATDVAARGIHIDNVTHVVNYNMPNKPENYVHRIGRTGRAGKKGKSISFACQEDSFYIPGIEEYTETKFHCEYPPDEWLVMPPMPTPVKRSEKRTRDANIKPEKKAYSRKKQDIKDTKKKPVVKKQMARTVYKNGKMYRVGPNGE